MRRTSRAASAAIAALLVFGGVGCNDEDGDGAVTDEEVDDVEQQVDEEVEGQDD